MERPNLDYNLAPKQKLSTKTAEAQGLQGL